MNRPTQVILLLHALSALSHGGSRAYYYFPELKTWSEAQRYCRENHIDLATIETEEEWSKAQLILQNAKTDAWIGLYDDNNSWKWSLDDKYLYKDGNIPFGNWWNLNSDNWKSSEHCAEIDWKYLNDANCTVSKKSICYNEPTKSYHVITTLMNWTDAQSYCRSRYTDLTSIRNKQEKDTIFGMISVSTYWVGLSREAWKWSDQSSFILKKWAPNEGLNAHSNEFCASANFSGFIDDDCAQRKPFLCAVPVRTIFKVEFKTDSANLDEVLDSLLQNMEGQNIQNLTLHWRKKVNGKRFSRKEPDKTPQNADCS